MAILQESAVRFRRFISKQLVCGLFLTIFGAYAAQGQTYSVLHSFSGGSDGATPMAGLTIDAGGNLYGTANYGGNVGGNCGSQGCGVVYRLSSHNAGWILTPLYSFLGGNDGMNPQVANVVFGPDSELYSTTFYGGGPCQGNNQGCGTVFKLQPPPNTCHSVSCPWNETILHSFDGDDGSGPVGALVFDQSGNLYGVTTAGSLQNGGTVYQLNPSSGWMETVLFIAYGYPGGSVTMDHAGNLYGSTFIGNSSPGTIYQLMRSGSNWIGTSIFEFTGGTDGQYPKSGLILDQQGNLYGATTAGGSGQGGTVFQLSPSNGSWTYNLLYSFAGPNNGMVVVGPIGNLVMDATGNLYGTTFADGAFGYGAVFKLTQSGSTWTYTSLHDFTNGQDGSYPYSNLVFDTAGNIYGTASSGGASGNGVVFKLSQ